MKKSLKKQIPYQFEVVKKTDKGLTNKNYLITIDQEKYMLRVPEDDVYHLFNRDQEKIIIDKIKDKDYILPIKYYQDGFQIVKYEQSLKTFDEIENKDKIKKVANLMKKFHQSGIKVEFNFDPLKQINLYKKHISKLDINLKDYQQLFDKLKNHKPDLILCHNDWVAGNICFLNDKTFLIDFEYAGNNDRFFDIMSFLTENDLSEKEKKEFLGYMFEEGISDKDYENLKMYRDTNNLLWYLWAKMMYEFREETIYKEIAEVKLKQLLEEFDAKL